MSRGMFVLFHPWDMMHSEFSQEDVIGDLHSMSGLLVCLSWNLVF